MLASSQTQRSPLSSRDWEKKFVEAIAADFQTHDDQLIKKLSAASDNTMLQVSDHVRRYVTDCSKEVNEDRSLRGAEMKQMLPPAIAGQKNTIKVFEKALTLIQEAGLDSEEPARINARKGLEKASELLAQLESMRDHAPDAFSTKSLGYAGDLQTLHSLDCLLRYRLGESSVDTLATLIDCGHEVEGHAKAPFGSGENLRKRLAGFREKHAQLAQQTEAAVRLIPRK